MSSEVDFAWFVGIFEGEGSFAFFKDRPKALSIRMTDLDVLERVQSIVGGSISPLVTRQPHWKQAWAWTLTGEKSVAVVRRMLPILCQRRASRGTQYVESYRTIEMYRSRQKIAKSTLIEKVVSLRQSGLTHSQIAAEVGKDRTYISKLLKV